MVGSLVVFKNKCKYRLYVATWCLGVELNQLTFDFKRIVIGQVVEREYRTKDDFVLATHHYAETNAFNKQSSNYGRRVAGFKRF